MDFPPATGIDQVAPNREIHPPREYDNRRKAHRSARKDEERKSQFLNGAEAVHIYS